MYFAWILSMIVAFSINVVAIVLPWYIYSGLVDDIKRAIVRPMYVRMWKGLVICAILMLNFVYLCSDTLVVTLATLRGGEASWAAMVQQAQVREASKRQ